MASHVLVFRYNKLYEFLVLHVSSAHNVCTNATLPSGQVMKLNYTSSVVRCIIT
jgi:hypothetical protein